MNSGRDPTGPCRSGRSPTTDKGAMPSNVQHLVLSRRCRACGDRRDVTFRRGRAATILNLSRRAMDGRRPQPALKRRASSSSPSALDRSVESQRSIVDAYENIRRDPSSVESVLSVRSAYLEWRAVQDKRVVLLEGVDRRDRSPVVLRLKHDALVVERGPGRRRRIRLDVLTTATGDGCIAVYEEECLVCLVEAPQAHIEAAASKMADALTSARRFADQAQNAGNAARTRMTLSEMVVVGLSIAVLTNAIIQTYMQHRSCTLS